MIKRPRSEGLRAPRRTTSGQASPPLRGPACRQSRVDRTTRARPYPLVKALDLSQNLAARVTGGGIGCNRPLWQHLFALVKAPCSVLTQHSPPNKQRATREGGPLRAQREMRRSGICRPVTLLGVTVTQRFLVASTHRSKGSNSLRVTPLCPSSASATQGAGDRRPEPAVFQRLSGERAGYVRSSGLMHPRRQLR